MGIHHFEVIVRDEDGISEVSLSGPVDSNTFHDFQTGLGPCCVKDNCRVVVNCSELTYMHSSGVGLLLQYRKQAMIKRGCMALYDLHKSVRHTFDMLGATKILKVCDSRDEAIEYVNRYAMVSD